MKDIHPSFADIVPSVASVVARRFKGYVTKDDLVQECFLWAVQKNTAFTEMLDEPDTKVRQANERRIAWQMKRVAERFARREKANKSGYQTNDEAFYEPVNIAQLLPFVLKSIIDNTPLEQAQDMVNDGQPKKPSVPAESGTMIAMLVDIKQSFEKLDIVDKDILSRRYLDEYTLEQMAEYLQCAISTADRRINNAMNKLQDNLGGPSPYN